VLGYDQKYSISFEVEMSDKIHACRISFPTSNVPNLLISTDPICNMLINKFTNLLISTDPICNMLINKFTKL